MSSPEANPYVVRQGDHLRQLAHLRGVDPDAVWDHPLNAKLREERGSGDDLLPGDILFLPQTESYAHEVMAGTSNNFSAFVPRTRLDLYFEDIDGPLANEHCVVHGLPGDHDEGRAMQTTSEAGLELHVPVTVAEVVVIFSHRHHAFVVRIGHMDPIQEQAGVVKRLANLGYLDHEYAHGDGDVAAALHAFQDNTGLAATGAPNRETLDRLHSEAGAPARSQTS